MDSKIPTVNVNNISNYILSKLNLNNIYTIDPLRIKITDTDEPRAPTYEECEIIIKKLFDIYRQQKQQVN